MEYPEKGLMDEYLVRDLIDPSAPDDIALEKLYELEDEENNEQY